MSSVKGCVFASTFVDVTKALDTVNGEELLKVMQKFDRPEKFTQMVRQLPDGITARVTDNGAVSEALSVANRVKWGCVITPTLFILMFTATLMETDGQLLNQRQMHLQSDASTTAVRELLFADDCALNVTTEGDVQRSMGLFTVACDNFVNGTLLQAVDDFTYLDSTLSRNIKVGDEVARRTSKAKQALVCLQNTVWNQHGLCLGTKLTICKAVILPKLLYVTETWTAYKKQARRINHFHLTCLRRIMKLRWQDRISDTNVLERTEILTICIMPRQLQLRWRGHLARAVAQAALL
nr:unnamed protein product [Spirometra erinaceieuropaei]